MTIKDMTDDCDEVFWNYFVEPTQQALNLIFDRGVQPVLRRQLNIFSLVLLRYLDVLPAFLHGHDFVDTKLTKMRLATSIPRNKNFKPRLLRC